MKDISVYENRELSWLDFNSRVLEEAEDPENPLAERLSFLSIFQSNLDEFDMVRVGALFARRKMSETENKTNLNSQQQLNLIRKRELELVGYKDDVYKNLMKELYPYGIRILKYSNLNNTQKDHIWRYFEEEVRPFLSPQIVGKRQPFPFLRNKEIYALVELRTKSDSVKLGIIPCMGPAIKRMISVSEDGKSFMLVEDLILHYANDIFDRYLVKGKALIRVIRSAQIDVDEALDEDESDYRTAMEQVLKTRSRLCPLKLECVGEMDETVIQKACDYLDLTKKQVFRSQTPMNLSFLFEIQDMLRDEKNLFYERRVPQQSVAVQRNLPMMEQIRNKDILLSYPYESMKPFIRLLNEAAYDPAVVSIKMTLYRVATNSKIVEALIDAAENGKEVVVLVELRARFDEENNIRWSRQLEEAGCRVIYGLNHLKVHSKLCLITGKHEDKISYITQIGTGNYNEKTSKIYTDYSLMTASEEIGKEAALVMNQLAMGKTVDDMKHLLVAPNCLQNRVLEMIEEEIAKVNQGKEGYVGIKINSLTDKKIIDKLVEAGQAGVHIQMIVRGICCLRAQIPQATDNIEIMSVVGRFLEHSRIYIFGKDEEAKVYIGSADFMTRNTTRRVEIAVPVVEQEIKSRLLDEFKLYWSDDVKARVQNQGNYRHKDYLNGINAQEKLYERAMSKCVQQ